jgi:hypothetical protein
MATTPQVPPRFQQGAVATALQLGPLASLVGTWSGNGFNAIWRPDNPNSPPFKNVRRFLELNLTNDSFEFDVIPGVVPNRGVGPDQNDLSLYGLHYLQRTSDADPKGFSTAGQALHIEPGLFMNVPASINLAQSTIVRMGSIPHGVTVLMQGPNPGTKPTNGAPTIPSIFPIAGMPTFKPTTATTNGIGIQPIEIPPPPPASQTTSTEHVVPENQSTAGDVAGSQSNGPFPADFQDFVNDPNIVLRNAIAGQTIMGFIAIALSTTNVTDSIGNIPFLGIPNPAQPLNPGGGSNKNSAPNAFVAQAAATFWIEWVKIPDAPVPSSATNPALQAIEPFWPTPTFLQLQYSQVVILVFNGVLWPHVTVATMTLSNG